jgi:hypothetical protein
MLHKNLKSAFYTTPQNKEVEFERYLVETEADLKKFFKVFPQSRKMMEASLLKSLSEGYIILLTELTISGFNSYCFETKIQKGSKLHPSSFIRVTNIN